MHGPNPKDNRNSEMGEISMNMERHEPSEGLKGVGLWSVGGIWIKNGNKAGIAQWIECGPVNQRVACSIPSQGTCLGCGPSPQLGCSRGNHTLMFLSLSLSFPSPLSKNK